MNGALIIDKPSGITSAKVVSTIKRKYSLARVGHCGTLDPLATGVLVVLCGQATRLQSFLMAGKKSYQGVIQLGLSTSTDDIEGEILVEDICLNFCEEKELAVWAGELERKFLGKQLQTPPQVSAIKVAGQASYKRARKGESVSLKERQIEIFELKLKFISNTELAYEVCCSKGTYVRSLARDIGEYLGSAACIKTLRRTSSEPFSIAQACALDELDSAEKMLLPFDELVSALPRVVFSQEDAEKLLAGNQTALANLSDRIKLELGKTVCVFDEDSKFISLLEKNDENWKIRFSASSLHAERGGSQK